MNTTARTFAPALALLAASPLALAQSADFAEGNAGAWGAFASDNAARSVANSTARVKDGASSILFTTASGFDTGVTFPAAANWNFNASAFNTLVFWEYPENSTPIGWQGDQPIVVIRTGTGTIRLEPQSQLAPNFAWRLLKAPLAGGNGWVRTTTGTPNLADIDQIEIHHDTWDYGFRVFFDGVRFMNLSPTGLPPAGPPPPPGVNPHAIESKVYLYVFDPIMENFGGRRMHEVYGWQDPITLTQQVIADMHASSHGLARYEIVETVLADEYPRFEGGFIHNDETFAYDWEHRIWPSTMFDYTGFCNQHALGDRVDAGEIDEVWLYAPPIGGMWESCMAGQGAYWINGPTYPAAGRQRVFPIMGWNFERGVGEAIHSWGHRAENVMVHSYGSWQPNRTTTWNRFSLIDQSAPGLGAVGNVHFPVNAQGDYDYFNQRLVLSEADDWLNYPNLTGQTRLLNAAAWSPNGQDPQREYLKWWYFRMPHAPSRGPDGYLANWWRYLLDLEQFKSWNGNLFLTIGIPTVRTLTPANGAAVRGRVAVTASAEVDGALGRVDLYVDGAYVDSDYLAPYTFRWDATNQPGVHTVVTKAYELQNGTEGVSPPISVTVLCPTDMNSDGGVDGDDVIIFFGEWDVSGPSADFNGDGSVDGDDVIGFFGRWDSGC
ncbi:MAG: Ig-like domain-containing protein [Phycisphaerales bacterium]